MCGVIRIPTEQLNVCLFLLLFFEEKLCHSRAMYTKNMFVNYRDGTSSGI